MATIQNHVQTVQSPLIKGTADLMSGGTLSIHSGATLEITSGATATIGGETLTYQVYPRISVTSISGASYASAAKTTAKVSVGAQLPAGAALLGVYMRVASGWLASGVAAHSGTVIRVGLSGITSNLFIDNEQILSGSTAVGLRMTLSNAAQFNSAKQAPLYVCSAARQVKATISNTGANTSDISRGVVKVYVAYIPSAMGDASF